MDTPRLADKIIDFVGLFPSTLFIFGGASLFLYEKAEADDNLFLRIGGTLIAISFTIWILSIVKVCCKIRRYKKQYPIDKLNKDFYLVAFEDKVYLLDTKNHEIRWIKSWQTALDLGFVKEWTILTNVNLEDPSALIDSTVRQTKFGQNFKVSDFHYVDGIHTRGNP